MTYTFPFKVITTTAMRYYYSHFKDEYMEVRRVEWFARSSKNRGKVTI